MLPFRNPAFARVPWDDFYASHLDLAVQAEALGYDHVWLTEHHFVDDGYSPFPLPIAAAIAARTTRIRIGTFVLLLPLHDPVRVAEDAATVDVLSRGRFDLGLGLGYRVAEFTGFGVPRSERGARGADAGAGVGRVRGAAALPDRPLRGVVRRGERSGRRPGHGRTAADG
jgi:alkanesulfonate monooxygenase SsuD/methylene tetrahydromethanopterin reductase-like flavin-dependent oxidoreductase (luciferase family)